MSKPKPPAQTGQTTDRPGASGPVADSAEPRKRASLSMEKRLAIALASVLAAIKPVAENKQAKALFPDGAFATFNNAAALADEINQKTLKPTEERLKALEGEIAAASKIEALTAEGGAKKLGDLVKEMTRLQTRKANLIAQASATASGS